MRFRVSRRRWPFAATTAVIVVAAAGATTVFLVGSAQRRHDRAAYLAYERAALVPIREGGRIVEEEMKPSLGELRDGQISEQIAHERAKGWRNGMRAALASLLSLHPPSFLGDIEAKWKMSFDAYLEVPDLLDQAASAVDGARERFLDAAAAAGTRADGLFDEAARVMQFHRRRLGLGSTHDLPDPAATG